MSQTVDMSIEGYLTRIGYAGPRQPDYETLRGLHRAHLLTVPFENLNIHLGRPIGHNEPAFYDKLINQKRGGWCFELNGLFAWALRQLGFEVRLLSGTVRDSTEAGGREGDHLTLLVELEGQQYLTDVGFGNAFLEPLPLREGEFSQGYRTFRLAKEGDYWAFYNHPLEQVDRYDFTLQPYKLEDFAARSHDLQTSPDSGFVRTTVCQRFTPDGIVTLRGATLTHTNAAGTSQQVIEGAAQYREALQTYFGLDLGDTGDLWQRVWARHQQWLSEQAAVQV